MMHKKTSYLLIFAILFQCFGLKVTQSSTYAEEQVVFYDSVETDAWTDCELVYVTEETARTGSKSIAVSKTSATSNQASTVVTLSPNTEYVFEYYTKSDYDWGAVVQLLEVDTSNKIAQGQTEPSENGSEWKPVRVEFTTGELTDIRILVLGNLNGSDKGPVYIDDFTIYEIVEDTQEPEEPGETETDELRDASFEEQNGAWTLSENWAYSDEMARTGSYSAKLTGNEGGAYWDRLLKQTVSVEANTDYVVSFYAIANKDWGAQLKILDTSGNTLKFTGINMSEGWSKTEFQFNSGNLTEIVIGFMDQGGIVYIDDVSIRKENEEEEVTNDYVEPIISGTPADFSRKSEITVGYIGGSITQGAGADDFSDTWVYKTTQYLAEKTGKSINPIYAGVGGTGSDYGIYRLYDDVLRYSPDIVFIEFAINDAGRQSYAEVQRNIEGMIREILSMPKKVSIIMVFTTNNVFGAIDNVHQKVANYYGIPTINIQNYVKQRIEEGDFTWEDIGSDEVHPNSFGYQVYADYIQSVLESDFGKYVCYNTLQDEPMTSVKYNTPRVAAVDEAQGDSGWTISRGKAISSTKDAELTYTFKGQSFGFCNEVSGEGVRVIIDGDDYGIIYTNYGAPYRIVTEDLEDTQHTVVLKNVSDSSVALSSFLIDDNEEFVYDIEDDDEPPVQPEENEIIKNGGFENGTDGWSLGAHWSVVDEDSYSGNSSLKLNNTAAHWCIATQTVDVEPETDYILTYYINSQNHWGGVLKLFYDGLADPDQQIGFEVTSGWVRKTVELYTGNHSRLEIQFMDNGGVAWIDNVVLKKAGEAPKLLRNQCSPSDNSSEFPVDGEMKIMFDSPMETGTVNSETVKLYQEGNEQPIPLTIESINDFEFILKPERTLDTASKYELRFGTDIKSAAGTAVEENTVLKFTSAHDLFDIWNVSIRSMGTNTEAVVTFKNTSDKNENVLILLKTEKDGCVENITVTGDVIENNGEMNQIIISAPIVENGIYTVYVWDNIKDRNPLCLPVSSTEQEKTGGMYAEPGELNAYQNKDTNEISIYGSPLQQAQGKQATIILSEDSSIMDEDMSGYSSVDVTGKLLYVGQSGIDEDNQFADSFIMNAETYDYPVYVNAHSQQMEAVLHYYSAADISGIDDVINSTSAQELLSALTTGKNLEILGIDEELFNTLNKSDMAQLIFEEKEKLQQTQTITAQNMADIVRSAMAVQMLSEAESDSAADTILKKYKDVFMLEETTGYKTYNAEYMTDKYRIAVAGTLRNVSYTSVEAVRERFNEQVILKAFEYISNIAYIKTILNDNEDTLDWDLTEYNKLSDTSDVDIDLYNNKPYSNIDDLENEFKDAMNDNKENNNGSGSGSGGGTGGGSGGGSGSSQSWTVSTNIPKEELNPTEPVHPFDDLDNVLWAQTAIESLAQRGIVSGSGDGKFRPSDTVTREEFIKMLVGIFELSAENAVSDFKDVPEDAWYYKPVSVAFTLGITNGIDSEYFGTGLPVTRQDMACLIKNCMEYKGMLSSVENESTEFSDMNEISDYALESVKLMKQYGIINGYEDSTFRPKNTATRAEAAVMLYNAEGDIT